ncbi:Ammonium transporter [Aphelenchoides fujianensis]|nr:Ammonium transporter [Aphelenchoides fujianensis]
MAENNNAFFLVTMALIIFLMQCGFAFLEAGAVRSKNTTNILIKNLLDSCIAILSYWAIGWALAYGHNPVGFLDPFVGGSEFFLIGQEDYPRFFFQFVFAATAATIVSGAVAERTQFLALHRLLFGHLLGFLSAIVYPIVVHWGWHSNGWMAAGITINGVHAKYVDFAGSGMVHVCGGTISLVAAYIMGPRIGRFPNSLPLGGFLLMFCFLAFNGGSQADIVAHGSGKIVALAMVNSITAGASAGFTTLIVYYVRRKKVTLLFAINAVLAGMVAACAGCNNAACFPAAAIVVGTCASFLYLALAQLLITWKIDDPLEAAPVHLGGGVTGLIGAALFTNEGIVYGFYQAIFGPSAHPLHVALIQLLWTIVCTIAIFVWSFLTSVLLFGLLKKTGKLRVSPEVEIKGWDELENVKTHVYLNNNNDPANRSRKISNKGELSLEELAAAYERRTSPEDRDRKISLYHNPRNYEHPEHHFKATHTNVVPKRNVVKPAIAIPEGNGNEHDEH